MNINAEIVAAIFIVLLCAGALAGIATLLLADSKQTAWLKAARARNRATWLRIDTIK